MKGEEVSKRGERMNEWIRRCWDWVMGRRGEERKGEEEENEGKWER